MTLSSAWIVGLLKRAWLGGDATAAAKDKSLEDSRFGLTDKDDFSFAVFDSVACGSALITLDGRLVWVNRSLCEMLGYSPESILEFGMKGLLPPGDLQDSSYFNQILVGTIESYQTEKRYLHRRGHIVWGLLSVSLIRSQNGQPRYFLCQIQDITKYKRDENLLLQSQSLLQGIIEGTLDAVFVKDRDGRYLISNTAGARLIGKDVNEIIGKDDTELYPAEEAQRIRRIDSQVIKDNKAKTYETAVTSVGVTHALLFTKTPYRGHSGEISGVVVVARDITKHQQAAEHLENSRAELRALSAQLQSIREEERMRIAREIHDELGQVLTGLKIDVVSLTKRMSEATVKPDWQQLNERALSIAELINSAILTVRRISTELRPGLLDAVGLIAAIEWQAKEFERRTSIKCKLKLPQADVALDQSRSIAVFRIFQEILTNVTRHSQATEVNVTLEARESELFLEAKDNGRGIKASEFSNPKSLGLLGMRERALLLGGEFNILGAQGKGTTVTVRIPFEIKTSDRATLTEL